MLVKIPFDVEIPDSVTVAGIELTVSVYYDGTDDVIYGNSDVYEQDEILFDPTILVDFVNHEIKGWVDGEYEGDAIEATATYDANNLSSKILDIAKTLDNACRNISKSTKKSRTIPKFSDMVSKQRSKNIHKAYNGDDVVHISYSLSNGEIESGGFPLNVILRHLSNEPNKSLNKVAKEVVEEWCGYDYGVIYVDQILNIEGLC